jgi:hypothetical protein
MNTLSLSDALRMAAEVLRDVATTRCTPSGFDMDAGLAQLHADAADVLEKELRALQLLTSGKT